MPEVLKILENLEIFTARPGFYIAFVCALTFLFRLQIIFEFISSSYDLFDKVSQRKYLKFRAICEDSLASNENKNIAKEKIDSFHFKQLHGIYANEKLRDKLIELASYSQDERIWIYIRSSIRYLTINEKGLLEIRSETWLEALWRGILYFIAAISLSLTLLCLYLLIYKNLEFKLLMLITFSMVLFYSFTLLIAFQTSYTHSLKKIDQEIKKRTKIKFKNKN